MKVKCTKYFDTNSLFNSSAMRPIYTPPIFEAGELYDCTFSDMGTIMLISDNVNIKITKITFDTHFIEVSDYREEQINKLIN